MKQSALTGGARRNLSKSLAGAGMSGTTQWIEEALFDDNRFQPRTRRDETAQDELRASIDANGQLSPVLARPLDDGRFELAFGHGRRLAVRAGANAGLPGADRDRYAGRVRAEIRALTDDQMRRYAVIENELRSDMNDIDRGAAYLRIKDNLAELEGKAKATWQDVERVVGIGYRQMHRLSGLQELPDEMKIAIAQTDPLKPQLKAAHGYALLELNDDEHADQQKALFRQISKENLSGAQALDRARQIRTKFKVSTRDQQAMDIAEQHQKTEAQKSAEQSKTEAKSGISTGRTTLSLVPASGQDVGKVPSAGAPSKTEKMPDEIGDSSNHIADADALNEIYQQIGASLSELGNLSEHPDLENAALVFFSELTRVIQEQEAKGNS